MEPLIQKIFISSPGDVDVERQVAAEVLAQIQGELGDHVKIETVVWEKKPLRASGHFQTELPPMSAMDIVVVILWSRLGTPIAAQIVKRNDGTPYQSGTEQEFLTAIDAFRESGNKKPNVFVYRKTGKPESSLDPTEAEIELRQKKALHDFIETHFKDGNGGFTRAYTTFETPHQFRDRLKAHLADHIRSKLPSKATEPRRLKVWFRGSPFRGLKAFAFEDHEIFFGRSSATRQIVDAMARRAKQGTAFVLIFGASGVGKSSALNAGVIPNLCAPGAVQQVDQWCRCLLHPSESEGKLLLLLATRLLEAMAAPNHVVSDLKPDALAKLLASDTDVAIEQIREIVSRVGSMKSEERRLDRPHVVRLALVVDQFEEVFTHPAIGQEERERFVHALSGLAKSGFIWVFATARNDFYDKFVQIDEFIKLRNDGALYDLLPSTVSELESIIRDAAASAGLEFEYDDEKKKDLGSVLLDIAGRQPYLLPLLEFTLEQLYEKREKRDQGGDLLTFKAYAEIGGLEGGIAAKAEEVLQSLSKKERDAARSLLLHLVTIDHKSSDRRAKHGLSIQELPKVEGIARAQDAFVNARLLVTALTIEGVSTVTLAHDALLEHWPTLKNWVTDKELELVARERLEHDAKWWIDGDRDPELLLRQRPLARAKALLKDKALLSGPVIELITASARRGNLRILIWTVAILAMFAYGLLSQTRHDSWKPVLLWGLLAGLVCVGFYVLRNRQLSWPEHTRNRLKGVFWGVIAIGTCLLMIYANWVPRNSLANHFRDNVVPAILLICLVAYLYCARWVPSFASLGVRRSRLFWAVFSVLTIVASLWPFLGSRWSWSAVAGNAVMLLLLGRANYVAWYPQKKKVWIKQFLGDAGVGGALGMFIGLTGVISSFDFILNNKRSTPQYCADHRSTFREWTLSSCTSVRPTKLDGLVKLQAENGTAKITLERIDHSGKCSQEPPADPFSNLLSALRFEESGYSADGLCRVEVFRVNSEVERTEHFLDAEGRLKLKREFLKDGGILIFGKPSLAVRGVVTHCGDPPQPQNYRCFFYAKGFLSLNSQTQTELGIRSTNTRRWKLNADDFPEEVSFIDDSGRPIVDRAWGFATLRVLYAKDGGLLEAQFVDQLGKPVTVPLTTANKKRLHEITRITWEYDDAGICGNRTLWHDSKILHRASCYEERLDSFVDPRTISYFPGALK